MRVLSWDVGLRTLSYCLIEAEVEATREETVPAAAFGFKILAWESVDVQADSPEAAPASVVEQPNKRAKKSAVKSATTVATFAAVSVEDGARMIMDALHRRADVLACGVDAIIIEQQPAGGHNQQSNVRMKVMSHAIQCYFYTRSLLSHVFVPPTISFVGASSKFSEMPRNKGDDGADAGASVVVDARVTEDSSSTTTLVLVRASRVGVLAVEATATAVKKPVSGYARNKKYAVQKTVELLTRHLAVDHHARKLLESTKKKDDLADSFLLGYYFLKKKFDAHQIQTAKVAKKSRAVPPPPMSADAVSVQAPKGRKRKAVAETTD